MSLLTDVQTAAATFVSMVTNLVTQTGYLISVITGPAGGSGSLVDVGTRTLKTLSRVLLEIQASKAFTAKGLWSSGTTYDALDAVFYVDQSYVSMIDGNVGNQPDTNPDDWMRLFEPLPFPWFDVIAYGAVGDGATDDTAALQAAIDAASGSRPGIIRFPGGVFKTSHALNISSPFLSVQGSGKLATIIRNTSTTENVFSVTAPYTSIDDMALVGPQNAVCTAGAAIFASGAHASKFTNLWVSDTYNGIILFQSTGVLVQFNKLSNLYGTVGIQLSQSGGDFIINNVVDPVFFGGGIYGINNKFTPWAGSTHYNVADVVSNAGFWWSCITAGTSASSGGPQPAVFNTTVTDGTAQWQVLCSLFCELIRVDSLSNSSFIAYNDISGPCSGGLTIDGTDGTIVQGNTLGQNISSGIKLSGGATSTRIVDNILVGTMGAGAPNIADASGGLATGAYIAGNACNGAGAQGILVVSNNATVIGNFVTGAGLFTSAFAIEIGALTGAIVTNNIIDTNYGAHQAGSIKANTGATRYLIKDNIVHGHAVSNAAADPGSVVADNI